MQREPSITDREGRGGAPAHTLRPREEGARSGQHIHHAIRRREVQPTEHTGGHTEAYTD